jgi:hypothetical protein
MVRLGDVGSEENGEIFCVLRRIVDVPTIFFPSRAGERIALSEKRRFDRWVRADVSTPIIDLARMVSLVSITMNIDQ